MNRNDIEPTLADPASRAHFVGGTFRAPAGETSLPTTDPSNGRTLATFVEATEGEGFVPRSLTQVVTLVPDLQSQLNEDLNGWRILPESGSGELSGLAGEGSWEWRPRVEQVSYTLWYRL